MTRSLALAVALGLAAPTARAGNITNHAETRVNVAYVGLPNDVDAGPLTSHSSVTYQRNVGAQGDGYAAGSATVTYSGATGFGLSSAAEFSMSPGSTALVQSFSTWHDILTLSAADPNRIGTTLRLTFTANGYVGVEDYVFGSAESSVHVSASDGFDLLGQADVSAGFTNGRPFSASGWDSIQSGPSAGNPKSVEFSGTFHLDFRLTGRQNGPGGPNSYLLNVTDKAEVSGYKSAWASDPISLQSITLPDVGNVTPESLGVTVSFDSGMPSPNLLPAAVPEPASLALGTGAVGLLGLARRRAGRRTTA